MLKNSSHTHYFSIGNPWTKVTRVILFFALSGSFNMCTSKSKNSNTQKPGNNKKIAQVFDREIYSSELKPYVQTDSATMASSYIDKIILEESMLRVAKENGDPDMDEIEAKTLQFKNSLIILNYQNQYFKKNTDTAVSEQALKTYYDQNSHSFILSVPVFKGYFIKVPENTPKIEKLKYWMVSGKPSDIEEIRSFCLRYASIFLINYDAWEVFPDNSKDTKNINRENIHHIIRNRQVLTYQKEDHLYLVRLSDFRFERQQSPFEFCRQEIKKLLINKRKMQAWSKLNKQAVADAKLNHHIEIYP